ncbi:uncharacterized protein [Argopecten irradians]|uniref:uncharacterized protein n=1 Tax=Argopecten irradians TaxID=31199 RepID=UPI0037127AC8
MIQTGCRSLGIISKYVTATLWRVIENDSHILEMRRSQSTIKHNKFFFGQLDSLITYRPNVTTLCNETFLMFSQNKAWLARGME